MIHYIYKLIHPVTGDVGYVGATSNLKNRLNQHINTPHNKMLKSWIKSIKKLGRLPLIKVIKKCTKEFRGKLEMYFIAYYSEKTNYTLCNSGYGSWNYIDNGTPQCRRSTVKDILGTRKPSKSK